MLTYPMNFKAQVQATEGTNEPWRIQSCDTDSQCAIPAEFGGQGGAFSPEDFFAQALTNCFIATFKVYAQASRLQYSQILANADLVVDLGESGRPVMKSFLLNATIEGAVNKERIRTVAERAFASGFILNSVKTQISLHLVVA
jgi:organic hydroperoxide reductase OsmC/OhrA